MLGTGGSSNISLVEVLSLKMVGHVQAVPFFARGASILWGHLPLSPVLTLLKPQLVQRHFIFISIHLHARSPMLLQTMSSTYRNIISRSIETQLSELGLATSIARLCPVPAALRCTYLRTK